MSKIILFVSLILTLLLVALIVLVDFNGYKFCEYSCQGTIVNVGESLLFFPLILIFSLITYFAPIRVFASWWKFARLAIPALFVPILLINLELHHDPLVSMPQLFDIPALILLYGIFIFGSLWQIWKGWKLA